MVEQWPDIEAPVLTADSSISDIAEVTDFINTVEHIVSQSLMASLAMDLGEVRNAIIQAMNDTVAKEEVNPPTAEDYAVVMKVAAILHELGEQWDRYVDKTLVAYKASREERIVAEGNG